MSAQADLGEIIRQLRIELEWAVQTGLEVEFPDVVATPVSVAATPVEDLEPLPPEAGSPAVIETESADATGGADVEDAPPPAFEPDPPEPTEPERERFDPERARQRKTFQPDRPWERYIPDDEGEPSESSNLGDPHGYAALTQAQGLEQIREILGDCTRCKLHSAGRTKIVFGVGDPQAELMFVGEGPGRQEDRQGEPFVGDAGQLLTRIIERGMQLQRDQVYIANIVKCRPPNNRDPMPDEVEACEPFLKAQIRQIRPKVIVALGKYAAQTLLRSKIPISRLRGKWTSYEGIDLMPTYHPAYLLRNPNEKRPVWEDVQAVMRRLEELKR